MVIFMLSRVFLWLWLTAAYWLFYAIIVDS